MAAEPGQVSQAVEAHADELAEATTALQYARQPELLDLHGDAGRAKCLQDSRYHFANLASALAFGSPAVFRRYITWAQELLVARGIRQDELAVHLECMCQALRRFLPQDLSVVACDYVQAGQEVLQGQHV